MSFSRTSTALAFAWLALHASADATPATYPTCESYGVDFQSDGTYFQNASSPDPFTFVSIFKNCQDDVAYNILVDPNGDEHFCDDVPMQPDDTNQVSSCSIPKNQMWTGPWGIIISSNNGDGGADPIAYERDFNLVVATPLTVTYNPTITIISTTSPLVSVTNTFTTTSTVISVSTTTQPAQMRRPTTTIIPPIYTTTKTWTLGTIGSTSYAITPVVTTKTITQTCSTSTQQAVDPWLTWIPTLLPRQVASSVTPVILSQAAVAEPTVAPVKRQDSLLLRRVPANRASRIAAHKKRLIRTGAFEDRGIDQSGVVITETNTALWSTATSTFTAATSIVTLSSLITQATTVTSIKTILQGTTTLPAVSITLPTPTKTALKLTVATNIVTVTENPTITVTERTAPVSATAICIIKGGRMVGQASLDSFDL